MHATNVEDAQLDLPERYTRFLQDLSSQQWGPDVNFESAFPRIEGRRLIAEHNLRQALQKYWSREDLNALRPLDLLFEFRTYAEETFKATASECVGLFHDRRSYESFLYVIAEWIVTEIIPTCETPEQWLVRQLELMESTSSLVELFEPRDQ